MAGLTVTYTNTMADVLRFQLFLVFRTSLGLVMLLGMLLPAGCLASAAVRSAAEDGASVATTVAGFLIAVVMMAAVFIPLATGIMLVGVWLTTRRSPVLAEHTMTLSDDTVTCVSAATRSEHLWTGIERIRQTRARIFLFLSRSSAHIIPKKSFGNPREAQEFVDFARDRWRESRTP